MFPVARSEHEPIPEGLGPMFTVFLNDDASTFGPWPRLADLFGRLDEIGAAELHNELRVATSWAGLIGDKPLVKLKLDVLKPTRYRSSARILLLADNYAENWQHIAAGGTLAVITTTRLAAAQALPEPTPADVMERSLLVGIGSSPVLEQMGETLGWPGF